MSKPKTFALAAAVLAGLVACSAAPAGSGTPAVSTVSAADPATSATMMSQPPSPSLSLTPTATKAKPRPPTHAQLLAQATAKVKALIAGQPAGGVSVAALNMRTGARFSAGATSGMWTASAYKLFVLETLLLNCQQAGAGLSSGELTQATTMIENSDNVAGYALFLAAGGNAGLAAAAARFGMTHTVPGRSDPTFTTTSANDYLELLKNLVAGTVLSAYSRSLTLNLMRNVEADQRWGVGVVADRGSDFANKNGWLSIDNTNGPGETDNGLWAVNSVGIVTVHGQQLLLAVFTRHQSDYQTGINLVQALTKAMTPAVTS
jgi:Beta-lactamase enzyme family